MNADWNTATEEDIIQLIKVMGLRSEIIKKKNNVRALFYVCLVPNCNYRVANDEDTFAHHPLNEHRGISVWQYRMESVFCDNLSHGAFPMGSYKVLTGKKATDKEITDNVHSAIKLFSEEFCKK